MNLIIGKYENDLIVELTKYDLVLGSIVISNTGTGAVDSVFGRTGAVVAVSGDYDYTKIANTPTIPTKTSDLSNDSSFTTLSAVKADTDVASAISLKHAEGSDIQDLSGLALKTNVLGLDNTSAFTPSADYEPATKKYVDDNMPPGGGEANTLSSTGTGISVVDTKSGIDLRVFGFNSANNLMSISRDAINKNLDFEIFPSNFNLGSLAGTLDNITDGSTYKLVTAAEKGNLHAPGSDDQDLSTYTTATAAIADHAIVRGDGGARIVQGSGPTINDTGEINMTSQKITSLLAPTSATDAANKEYVDRSISFIETYYFNNTASDLGGIYYKMLDVQTGEAASTFITSALGEADDQNVYNFATDAGIPGVNNLKAGIYNIHIHANVDSGGSKPAKFYYRIYSRTTGGTETLRATSEISEFLTTDILEYDLHASIISDIVIATTDRIIVKLYCNISASGTDAVVTFYAEDNYASRFSMPTTTEVLSSIFVRQDGSKALTANWDAGSFKIIAQQLESDVATGTAPLIVASTTKVTNLNADKLDDLEASAFVANTLFDANTILAANSDNTPAAVTVLEQTLVGRITGGNIDDLSVTQVRTLLGITGTKDFAIENPTATEKKMWFFTQNAITITKLVAVLIGSSSQSVTWKVFHDPDRSAAGNAVVTAGTATTSISTGSVITSFDDATIPADSFVWIETSAKAGTVTDFFLHCDFTRD